MTIQFLETTNKMDPTLPIGSKIQDEEKIRSLTSTILAKQQEYRDITFTMMEGKISPLYENRLAHLDQALLDLEKRLDNALREFRWKYSPIAD